MSTSNETGFDSQQNARQYYGQELSTTADLKTTACCTTESIPDYVREVLPEIHAEVLLKYYGCGTAFPPDIQNLRVLDLGCGSGRDTYIMSKLVGAAGFVYGLDMTPEQIEVAQRHSDHMAGVFGYEKSNVEFVQDVIENMDRHFEADSLDMVTSNCVINLLADKEPVLAQVFGLLRQGGEFYFSDVYVDRRLPTAVQTHPMLHGECLGGALYDGDFVRMARRVGFADPRLVSRRVIELEPEVAALVGSAVFTSCTYRLWKIEGLENTCEDFGQVAIYNGGHPSGVDRYTLDGDHVFEQGRPEAVCGNTAKMLTDTRLAPYFTIHGNDDHHYGLFSGCGTEAYRRLGSTAGDSGCGC